jgi:hypothetical protein
MTISAHTAMWYENYPAYYSLNERDGVVVLTVRSQEADQASEVALEPLALLHLRDNLNVYLKGIGVI